MFGERNSNPELKEILFLCKAMDLDSDMVINTFNRNKLKVKLKKLRKQALTEGLDIDFYKENKAWD
jgi:hypothetical protein